MRGRTIYRNPDTGIEVTVSKPAEQLIGPQRVGEVVALLTELLDALGAKWAMVGKCGSTVEIHFEAPGFKGRTWKIPACMHACMAAGSYGT